MKNKTIILLLFAFFFCQNINGQTGMVHLENPSFEGVPNAGTVGQYGGFKLSGWSDCGFEKETAPDVHAGEPTSFFNTILPPQHGETYMGLVVRDNETWERAGQKLKSPLKANERYRFHIYLARSMRYESPSRNTGTMANYVTPCKLRIWGGKSDCGKVELLAESPLIANADWKKYEFVLSPNEHFSHIVFEAFYKTPTQFPYNGNLLLDNASTIVPISGNEFFSRIEQPEEEPEVDLVEPQGHEFEESVFDEKVQLVIFSDNPPEAEKLAKEAFERAKEIEVNVTLDLATIYEHAEKEGVQAITDDTWEILSFAKKAYRTSGKKFDVTTGGHRQMWHEAAAEDKLPNPEKIKEYATQVVPSDLIVTKSGFAKSRNKMLRLDIDELAMGYVLDEMAATLEAAEATTFHIKNERISVARDRDYGRPMWNYERPHYFEGRYRKEEKKLSNANIVTMGASGPLISHEGERFYDFIQPKTGMAVTQRNIITIQAASCMEAIAWARALATDYDVDLHLKIKKEGVKIWSSGL